LKEEKRFANLELFQTSSDWVYYNTGLAAINNQPGEATLVQSYLEMSKGDKRQQEAAEQIREKILATFPGRK
jgi:hypothetical protein